MPETKTKTIYNGKLVDGADVPILSSNEQWSDYRLEDGTAVRTKFVVSAIVRLDGEYDADDNPVYAIKGTLVANPMVPESLRKGKK